MISFAESPQDGQAPLEDRRLTAGEDGQVAGLGTALAFGDRRVQYADAARGSRRSDFLAGGGFHGARDDHHASRFQTGQNARRLQRDRLDLRVIGHHHEHGLAVRPDLPG